MLLAIQVREAFPENVDPLVKALCTAYSAGLFWGQNNAPFEVNITLYKTSLFHRFLKQYIVVLYTAKALKSDLGKGTTIQTWPQCLHFDCFSPDPTQLFPLDLLQYLGKVALTLTLQDVNACLKVFVLD